MMRFTTTLSIAVGAIALTILTPVPRASAMPAASPAVLDRIAPNDGQAQNVRHRRVCERYRYWSHGHWRYRTRCYYPSHRAYRYNPYRYGPHRYNSYRYSGPGFYFGFR